MKRQLIGTEEHKTADLAQLTVKTDDGAPGRFQALAAVYGNIDSHGDRMVRGCFEVSLKERGFPKLVWSHDRLIPPIGIVEAAEEVDAGLLIDGRLFVDKDAGEDHPIARQVWAAMSTKGGDGRPGLGDFSFGARVQAATLVEVDPATLPDDLQWTGGRIREITRCRLWEIGPCLVGANEQAGLLTVKSLVDALGVTPEQAAAALERRDVGPTKTSSRGEVADRTHATRLAELRIKHPIPSED
ncbi:MAG: HK97 family phage prohead protease [Patulibacter sp.]|nr:HK97 family phage prohead protease [Patulibacter sp.]